MVSRGLAKCDGQQEQMRRVRKSILFAYFDDDDDDDDSLVQDYNFKAPNKNRTC